MNKLFAPIVVTLVLTACGGGGGPGGAAAPPVSSHGEVPCTVQETVSSHTLCMSPVQVNGASFTVDPYVSASLDFNGDGFPDAVLSTNTVSNANTPSAVSFITGTANPTVYNTASPAITGGTAGAWFARDIVVNDFNGDGKPDFYIADASEYTATGTLPWNGTNQYYYINNGTGGFVKTDTGVSALVHGAGGANSAADGFSLALNTPWSWGTTWSMSNVYFHTVAPTGETDNPLPGASSFCYSTTIDVNHDGKKDIIGFSAPDFTHKIYINDGTGHFTAGAVIPNFVNSNVVVESVAVADLNGDGWDDFVTMQIDRTVVNSNYSSMRVYINDQAGSFTDATTAWIGANFQNNAYKFFQVQAFDVNNDGKADLVFVHDVDPVANTRKVEVLTNTGTSFATNNFTNLTGYIGETLIPMHNSAGNYLLVSQGGAMKAMVIK